MPDLRKYRPISRAGLLDMDLPLQETVDKIHKVIQEHIGADLAVILKTKEQLEIVSKENTFDGVYDFFVPYWNLLWGAFILLGAFVFCFDILLLKKRAKRRNG